MAWSSVATESRAPSCSPLIVAIRCWLARIFERLSTKVCLSCRRLSRSALKSKASWDRACWCWCFASCCCCSLVMTVRGKWPPGALFWERNGTYHYGMLFTSQKILHFRRCTHKRCTSQTAARADVPVQGDPIINLLGIYPREGVIPHKNYSPWLGHHEAPFLRCTPCGCNQHFTRIGAAIWWECGRKFNVLFFQIKLILQAAALLGYLNWNFHFTGGFHSSIFAAPPVRATMTTMFLSAKANRLLTVKQWGASC